MSSTFPYESKYLLDKPYFNECYSQSAKVDRSLKAYFKPAVLAVFGLGLIIFTTVNLYVAWFVVALAAVEAVSIRFHQAWWVTRQMLSKASGSEVTLTIDDKGVHSKSFYNQQDILWCDVKKLQETELGFVLFFDNGKSYLSKKVLSDAAQGFLKDKASQTN